MQEPKKLYRAVFLVLPAAVQSVVTISFDPPIEHAPKIEISTEPNGGYYELKEVKDDQSKTS